MASGDFFADKKYQQMDWISQAVSPWEYEQALKFAAIPEVIEVTPELLVPHLEDALSYRQLSATTIINKVMQWDAQTTIFSGDNCLPDGNDLFSIEIQPGTNFDMATMCFDQPVYIRKMKAAFDDEDCKNTAARWMREEIAYNMNGYSGQPELAKRAGEILDLLNINVGGARSLSKRRHAIKEAVYKAVMEDVWRVRNMELAKKVAKWIVEYINEGQLSAMANFAKFKVMTHSGQAIYSIQEVE